MADRVLNDEEVRYLDLWLRDNEELAEGWPADVISTRVRHVLADGRVTQEEREHLKQTLSALLGGTLEETGAATGGATRLPIDAVATIEIPNRRFCFTGTFLFGTRAARERAVEGRGGIAIQRVTQELDYLVIGTMTTHSWANTSFGRKIEKAVEYQKRGEHVKIVSEQQWESCIRAPVV